MKEIVKLLGFLAATGDYSYVDKIGNAIDEVTLLDALKDALRAYQTYCAGRKEVCIEYGEGSGISCPELEPDAVERAISEITALASKVSRGEASRIELSRLSRELALRAYAIIPVLRRELACTPKR